MKFEREATTKDGRRTWKVTYELLRGPEPKRKQPNSKSKASSSAKDSQASRAATVTPAKAAAKKTQSRPTAIDSKREKKTAASSQLGLF